MKPLNDAFIDHKFCVTYRVNESLDTLSRSICGPLFLPPRLRGASFLLRINRTPCIALAGSSLCIRHAGRLSLKRRASFVGCCLRPWDDRIHDRLTYAGVFSSSRAFGGAVDMCAVLLEDRYLSHSHFKNDQMFLCVRWVHSERSLLLLQMWSAKAFDYAEWNFWMLTWKVQN